jgi:ABC-2 type transport system permease protein
MTTLRGTGALVRLALRLDRIKLPMWILGLSGITLLTASAFQDLYPTEASRELFGQSISTNPALRAMLGPLFDASSVGGLTAWRIGFALVLGGLMGFQAVVRHTRAEEETGRQELVGSAVVGRYAGLTAALIVAFVSGLVMALLTAAGLIGLGLESAGSVALGLSLAVPVWTFAGIGALAAQLTNSARAANGISGVVLGLSYLLRALGDSAGDEGASWLSWLSPLGWAQQLRPFGSERWWVLGLAAAFTVVLATAGYALLSRRDVDAGLLAARPGRAEAAPSLRSPLALAWRLQRGTLLGWTIGFAVVGLAIGGIASSVADMGRDNPQLAEILEQLGGAQGIVDAYIAGTLGIIGVVASVYAVQAVLRLRSEETAVRAEPVLATRVTRLPWAASHVTVAVIGTAVVLAAAGAAMGLMHGLQTGDVAAEVPRVLGGAMAQLPAALVLAGIALALFGVIPRLTTLSWGLLAVTLVISQLGPMLRFDQWVLDIAPFTHVPQLPGSEMTWTPLVWLAAVAVASAVFGFAGFHRRDIATG